VPLHLEERRIAKNH